MLDLEGNWLIWGIIVVLLTQSIASLFVTLSLSNVDIHDSGPTTIHPIITQNVRRCNNVAAGNRSSIASGIRSPITTRYEQPTPKHLMATARSIRRYQFCDRRLKTQRYSGQG